MASASGLPADEGKEILTPLRAQTIARDQVKLLDYIDEKMPELAELLGEKSLRYKGYRRPFVNSIAFMHDTRFDDYEFSGKTSSLEETCKSWALSAKDAEGNHIGIVVKEKVSRYKCI
ncbi:MAG: hypothetical protein KTR28_09355 [Micavibrio sp.]|nr:hypothetical protein [Micavibrio sp.]